MLSRRKIVKDVSRLVVVEAGLWGVLLVCAVLISLSRIEAKETQQAADAIQPLAPELAAEQGSDQAVAASGMVMGRMSVKQLGLDVPILESYDPAALSRGVGHVPGTALPGGLGNLVLAGHRDTYFRPLRNVRAGMKVEVATDGGTWDYAVDSTEIVTPDRVDVADIGERPGMTLITCYPFSFVGAAPKRFIVHAHLVSADAN